ncbi:MAG: ATP-binding protein [Steroidobacter sp.]
MQDTSFAAEKRRTTSETDSVRRRFGAAAVVLLAGLSATLTTFLLQRSAEIRDSQQQFTAWAEERGDVLQKAVDAHLEILHGVRALFDSSEFVSAEEFDRYTAAPLKRYPHIYSLDWLPRVTQAQRALFEARASEQLGIEYRIREYAEDGAVAAAATRPEYWPILYAQARDGLRRTGVDAYALAANAAAMGAAAQTNRASAAIVEVRASIGEPPIERFQVYLPIFDRASMGAPPGEVLGFVRTTFSIDDMLEATLSEAAQEGVAVELVDPFDMAILGSMTPVSAWRRERAIKAFNPKPLRWTGQLQVADHVLNLQFASTPGYARHPKLSAIWALLAAGTAVTLLGAVAAFHLTRRRLRLQRLTKELLAENAERRHSQQLLSQTEARYRVLVENSPDAILLNRDGRILFANRASVRLLKAQSADELVGKSVFDIVHPDFHEIARDRMHTMTQKAEVLPAVEQRLLCLDGSTVDVEVVTMPFQTENGVTMQVTARDITQRRAAEAERANLEAALRQSQKLEAVGTLAGGIAHDFNNILSAIVGNTRLLLEDLSETHPGWRSVKEIRSATHRARDLVKRLMAFSRQQETQRTAVPLAPLIMEVQHLLRATIPAGIELIARIPPGTPPILADATQIHQVLLNLCTNAWQAMPGATGRIELSVTALSEEDARVQSGAPLHGASRYVCIGVHDNGAGMPQETLEHIFEPFFTTKQPGEGSGLGLAVVHGIVQSHKGAITVTSQPGAGTSFLIYLPVCEATPVSFEATQRVAARGGEQHILYIDDEEPLVFLAQRTLERAGYRCTGEMNAARALEAVRSAPQSFDLVITDLNMPGMSGLDVSRELLSIRRDLPVVITTGYVRAADAAAARELGVRDMILKPDTIDELAAIVQKFLIGTVDR